MPGSAEWSEMAGSAQATSGSCGPPALSGRFPVWPLLSCALDTRHTICRSSRDKRSPVDSFVTES